LRHPVDWALGPVFTKELRVISRRRRHFVLRFAYLAALLLFLVIVWLAADVNLTSGDLRVSDGSIQAPSAASQFNRMSEAGKKITAGIIWFQFIAMQLLALVLNSGAILDEARRRTLSVLLSSPITPVQIVAGKLAGSLLQLMILLLISLPLLAMVRVLGGVDWMFLISTLCVTVTGTFIMGALSLRFSVTSREPLAAMAKALFWYAILFLAPVIYASPSFVMYQLYQRTKAALPWDLLANLSWIAHCLIAVGVTWFLVRWSARSLRNVSLEGSGQSLRTTGPLTAIPVRVAPPGAVPPLPQTVDRIPGTVGPLKGGSASSRSPVSGLRSSASSPDEPVFRRVTGSPLVWKELRFFNSANRKRTRKVVGMLVGFMLLIYAMLLAQGSFGDFQQLYLWIYLLLGLVITAALAPQCIASEKQSQAMLALLTTPVSDWHIVLCKALGVFKRALPVWLLAMGHVALAMGLHCMTGGQAIRYLLILVYLTIFVIGLGLYFSSKFRAPSSALIALLAALVTLWIILPALPVDAVLQGQMGGSDLAHLKDWVKGASPFVQTWMLVGLVEPADAERMEPALPLVPPWAAAYIAAGAFFLWRAKARLRKDLF
jgi:ABC-type transport system involved in multi-copper enzyme maturation permease subunit